MTQYTTGDIAKACGVSVRTVQYYDARGILSPSELSEGGRRLYTDEDLSRMKVICFLRDLGMSIDGIKDILSAENHDNIIFTLLDEQEKQLKHEIAEKQKMVDKVAVTKKAIKMISEPSVNSIKDVVHIVENRKHLRNIRIILVAIGILMDVIQIATAVIWIKTGVWWPFLCGIGVVFLLGVSVFFFYTRKVAYICPECHAIFTSSRKQMLFSQHTTNTRKLKCSHCGYHGYCIETYSKENLNA